MNEILLSIIIPTYNRPKHLPLAVNSALAQTIDSFEVIIVDDCSSQPVDLPEDPRLRIIRLEQNQGGAAARNIGVKADLIFIQALKLYKLGLQKAAWKNLVWAMKVDPVRTLVMIGSLVKRNLFIKGA